MSRPGIPSRWGRLTGHYKLLLGTRQDSTAVSLLNSTGGRQLSEVTDLCSLQNKFNKRCVFYFQMPFDLDPSSGSRIFSSSPSVG